MTTCFWNSAATTFQKLSPQARIHPHSLPHMSHELKYGRIASCAQGPHRPPESACDSCSRQDVRSSITKVWAPPNKMLPRRHCIVKAIATNLRHRYALNDGVLCHRVGRCDEHPPPLCTKFAPQRACSSNLLLIIQGRRSQFSRVMPPRILQKTDQSDVSARLP